MAGPADCEALFRHLVDLELAAAGSAADPPTPEERAKVDQTLRAEFLEECRVTPAWTVKCALAATTSEAVARCE